MIFSILAMTFALLQGTDKPPMPFDNPGACPFECCHYGSWTATQSTAAHTDRSRQSPVLFKIKAGDKITAATGVVVTLKPGVVRLLAPHQLQHPQEQSLPPRLMDLPVGAVLYILHHGGEGAERVWYQGQLYWGELYADSVHKGNKDFPWDVDAVPLTEWWVKVRTSEGKVGWILNPKNFKGMDACS